MNRRQFICAAAACFVVGYAPSAHASQPTMTVYKDPTCDCCGAWASAIGEADIAVDVQEVEDINTIKRKYRVPKTLEGCHTAVIGGYFIEGHVPLEAVQRLLNESPAIAGLTVAGMPVGSLGMGDSPKGASYDVWSVGKSGDTAIYMSVRPRES